ncbi:MAG: AI-2E family transporter, partial [Bryobacteraceae bacterium]
MSIFTPSFQTQKPGHVSFTVLAAAAAIALLYFGRVFFITLVIAAMITFILDPLVNFFMKLRLPRGVASFVVCAMALTMVYLFGVGLYSQASRLVDDLPAYSQRINDLADTTA